MSVYSYTTPRFSIILLFKEKIIKNCVSPAFAIVCRDILNSRYKLRDSPISRPIILQWQKELMKFAVKVFRVGIFFIFRMK